MSLYYYQKTETDLPCESGNVGFGFLVAWLNVRLLY